MKYRIKIITYKNGRKEYIPMIKKGPFWFYLGYDGSVSPIVCERQTRESALHIIDLNYRGNKSMANIEFEYINKPEK